MTKDLRVITPYTHADASLNEIYNTGFQLAFVSPDDKMCHAWVLCKDFMNDAVWAQIHQKPVAIYAFKYDPATQPEISFDPVKIIVRDKTKDNTTFSRMTKKSLKFLNIVERQHGFPESKLEKVRFGDTKQSVWMFSSPQHWLHAPPMLSLLTLYQRIGCHYPGGGSMNEAIRYYRNEVKHNDSRYLKQSRAMRLLILNKGLSIFKEKMEENYPDGIDLHTVHHRWGIVNSPTQKNFQELWNLKDLDTMVKKEKEGNIVREAAVVKD